MPYKTFQNEPASHAGKTSQTFIDTHVKDRILSVFLPNKDLPPEWHLAIEMANRQTLKQLPNANSSSIVTLLGDFHFIFPDEQKARVFARNIEHPKFSVQASPCGNGYWRTIVQSTLVPMLETITALGNSLTNQANSAGAFADGLNWVVLHLEGADRA